MPAMTKRLVSDESADDSGRREIFWRRYEEGIELLRQDREAWAECVSERESEAGALRDGLSPG
jgi:hypothetical protein